MFEVDVVIENYKVSIFYSFKKSCGTPKTKNCDMVSLIYYIFFIEFVYSKLSDDFGKL